MCVTLALVRMGVNKFQIDIVVFVQRSGRNSEVVAWEREENPKLKPLKVRRHEVDRGPMCGPAETGDL